VGGNDSSVQSAVYNALRTSIMTLQLKPGTVMSTQEIAVKLDVSRTPVREAFIRLQRDGLIRMFPQKETIVSKINIAKVAQERFLRESLEASNLELFIHTATDDDLRELEANITRQKETLDAGDYKSLISLDNAFHQFLFSITGQELSWETIENTSNHYARIRLLTISDRNIMSDAIHQHEAMLQKIREKDVAAARSLFVDHLHHLENQLPSLIVEYKDYFEEEQVSSEKKLEDFLSEK